MLAPDARFVSWNIMFWEHICGVEGGVEGVGLGEEEGLGRVRRIT